MDHDSYENAHLLAESIARTMLARGIRPSLRGIARELNRSPAWGYHALAPFDEFMHAILSDIALEASIAVRNGAAIDTLVINSLALRMLLESGHLHTHHELRRALQEAYPDPPWLWSALLAVTATAPHQQVRDQVMDLLARAGRGPQER